MGLGFRVQGLGLERRKDLVMQKKMASSTIFSL